MAEGSHYQKKNIHSFTSCLCGYYITKLINFLHYLQSTDFGDQVKQKETIKQQFDLANELSKASRADGPKQHFLSVYD